MASGSSFFLRFMIIACSGLALAACQAELPGFLSSGGNKTTAAGPSARTVERDVEAPEIFQITDEGLWDGRPSLGGVWVAHPQVKDPERVIIRNEANGQFVIGVVYRPERSTPGPAFQVSSDAAAALEMLAGQPARLNVTALRREETTVPEDTGLSPAPEGGAAAVATSALDPIEAASEALDAAESAPAVSAAAIAPAASAPAPTPVSASASALDKPFVQIGIFSVESNALSTAEELRKSGMVPAVKEGTLSGKAFWRVIVGPATNASERTALLGKVKALGFADAYAVTN